MGTRARLLRASTLLLGVSGCASLDPGPAFEQAQHLAADRGVSGASWNRDQTAQQEIDARVSDLLQRELSPETAVQIALLRNRSLQAAFADLGIAQAELVQAGLLRNPVLTAAVRFGIGASGVGADLGLVQDFLDVVQIPLRRRVAQAQLEATTFAVGAAVFALAVDVKEAFFEAQGAQQMTELRQQVSEATQLSADLAQRQHGAGNLTDLDLANQQALHEEAKLALAEAEVDAFESREHLTALLGLWGEETRWSMAPRLPPLPAEDLPPEGLESLAVSRRLDLAAARRQVGAAASNVALVRFFGLVPEAGAGISSEREIDDGVWSLGPSLEIPVPLFDQSQARLAAGRALQRQSEESFAALAVRIRSEVRSAWVRLDTARRRVRYFEQVVLPLRSQIVDQTQREYNAMQLGVYQLLQAKRDEIEAGSTYVDSLRDYWKSHVALERALGTGEHG